MTTHYISRTYIDLWTAVELHVRLESKTQDKDERLAARISSLVFAFFTLEAYLNHLGAKARPDLWEGKNNRGRSSYLHILACKTYLTMLLVTSLVFFLKAHVFLPQNCHSKP